MIDKILEAICAAILAAAVALAFIAVIFRYAVGSSLSWSFEASLALLTYLTFVGCYLAMRKQAHLKVEVLIARAPRAVQAAAFAVNQLVILAIAAVMVVHGLRQTILFQDQTTLVMELPLAFLYAIIPLSGVLIGSQAVLEASHGWRRWRSGRPLFDGEGAGLEDDAPSAGA